MEGPERNKEPQLWAAALGVEAFEAFKALRILRFLGVFGSAIMGCTHPLPPPRGRRLRMEVPWPPGPNIGML